MSIPRNVAAHLNEHTTLEVESIDRMYLNLYVSMLQREGGIAHSFRHHRGQPFASSALMEPISRDFVEAIRRFADRKNFPIVRFKRKERKDEVAKQFLKYAPLGEGVLIIGVAQEKSRVVRVGQGRQSPANPATPSHIRWRIRRVSHSNRGLDVRVP
jgi:hypothetical protein